MKQFRHFRHFLVATSIFITSLATAQSPSYGTTNFNNITYDVFPFAVGSGSPSILTATNVANTYWNFHIGGLGVFTITQTDHGTTSYDGGIVATNVTPGGTPAFYQTFNFSTPGLTKFKLNSVKVKIDNSSALPIPMVLAGAVGTNAGTPLPFIAPPGSSWQTINTASTPGFENINGVLLINVNGNPAIAQMGYDDINISAPVVTTPLPVFTSHPSNATTCVGGSTSFTATATGGVSYFWMMSNDGIVWLPINNGNASNIFGGYNTNTLSVSNANLALNGLYLSCNSVNSAGGNIASNPARLYITNTLSAGTISGPNSLCVGATNSYTSTVSGGTWSCTPARLSINPSTGSATGTSSGATTIKYTVGSGACVASTTKSVTVNPQPAVPTIGYAPGSINPQLGATGGAFCNNRTFNVAGTPTGGAWSATGQISVNSAGLAITAATAGAGSLTYTVTTGGCSQFRTINGIVMLCAPKGVKLNNSTNFDKSFVVYPNPAKNSININLPNATTGGFFTITDMMGKQIKTQAVTIGNNNIDVTNFSKGIYFVSLTNAGNTTTQKIIVE